MKNLLLLFCLILTLPAYVSGQQFYADLSIDVQSDGLVKIDGITNDPSLLPGNYQDFTSKNGVYWLLNISSDKVYSDYILEVTLPEGTEINYLKTGGRSRISYDDGIKIVASGTDEMNLLVQYQIKEVRDNMLSFYLIPAFIAVIAFAVLWRERAIRKKSSAKNEDNETRKEITKKSIIHKKNAMQKSDADAKNSDFENILIVKKSLAENQEKIVDLLIEAGGELVQKQLQHRSALAKATLSRNIDILQKKGIILKQSRGMTNMIMLNKEFGKDK